MNAEETVTFLKVESAWGQVVCNGLGSEKTPNTYPADCTAQEHTCFNCYHVRGNCLGMIMGFSHLLQWTGVGMGKSITAADKKKFLEPTATKHAVSDGSM